MKKKFYKINPNALNPFIDINGDEIIFNFDISRLLNLPAYVSFSFDRKMKLMIIKESTIFDNDAIKIDNKKEEFYTVSLPNLVKEIRLKNNFNVEKNLHLHAFYDDKNRACIINFKKCLKCK